MASGITPAVMLGHATIAVNSTAHPMDADLNHESMIADSAAVVANKTVLAGLLAEPAVLTNNGDRITHTDGSNTLTVNLDAGGDVLSVIVHDGSTSLASKAAGVVVSSNNLYGPGTLMPVAQQSADVWSSVEADSLRDLSLSELIGYDSASNSYTIVTNYEVMIVRISCRQYDRRFNQGLWE